MNVHSLQHPTVVIDRTPDLGEIPINTPEASYQGMPGIKAEGPRDDLHNLRNQFPFLSILPFPDVFTKVLPGGIAAQFDLPSSCRMLMIKATGDIWLSWQDTAKVPIAGADLNQFAAGKAVYNPTDILFYCGGHRQLSIFSQGAAVVTVLCWAIR